MSRPDTYCLTHLLSHITPRISDAGLITLEIQIEKSDAATKDVFGRTSVPYFDKKTAKTTVSVLEGQTIVIGGLIEDTKKRNKGGVPLLSKIPVLGALFGVKYHLGMASHLIPFNPAFIPL